jgi:hypothetical protein
MPISTSLETGDDGVCSNSDRLRLFWPHEPSSHRLTVRSLPPRHLRGPDNRGYLLPNHLFQDYTVFRFPDVISMILNSSYSTFKRLKFPPSEKFVLTCHRAMFCSPPIEGGENKDAHKFMLPVLSEVEGELRVLK